MSENYALWQHSIENSPTLTEDELLQSLAQYGALAPSTHNTQPWLCKIERHALIIIPDFSKKLPYADPVNRGLYISLGCFVTNVRCAAASIGKSLTVKYVDYGDRINIHLKLKSFEKQDRLYVQLFDQVTSRISDKSDYTQQPVSPALISLLAVQNKHCFVNIISDKQTIADFAEQYTISAKKLAAPKNFRVELAHWLRPNFTRSYDGMPGFVADLPTIFSVVGPKVIPYVPLAAYKQVEKDSRKLRHSPAVGIIFCNDSNPMTWIQVGETYELVSLLATQVGISMTPMAAFVEEESGRAYLSQYAKNLHPQFFFRLGYSGRETHLHTPRQKITFR